MQGICKSFSGVRALQNVDLDLYPGEVHALVGENGAGKSTLMHILAGVHTPDAGSIIIDGTCHTITHEKQAQDLGIGMVYQEGSLFDNLSVGENIFAGRHPVRRGGRIDLPRLYAQTQILLGQFGMDLNPRILVERLTPAQKQQVEIAKALSLKARIMVFDEPTSSLTATEVTRLFDLVGRLQNEGVGIIYISHRLDEIFTLADRITVLKDGQTNGSFAKDALTPEALVRQMVGRDVLEDVVRNGDIPTQNQVLLQVENLSDHGMVREVSFTAREGEVTALAGLAGAGRTELALALVDGRCRRSGTIRIRERIVSPNCPRDALAAGMGYLPEDRKEDGLFLDMTIAHNLGAAHLNFFGTWWINERLLSDTADRYCRMLNVQALDTKGPVYRLSGGNQQKVLLARWLLVNPDILIVDEPTRGIDVGAKRDIHHLLHHVARQGTAVIMISSELPEILAVADRILVMRKGRLVGDMEHRQASEERIMQLCVAG